jgi:hypothetical protein
MTLSAPTDSNLGPVPLKVLPPIAPYIQRATATTRYERSPAKSYSIIRGERGIRVRAKLYSNTDLQNLLDLFDETENEYVHFDCRQSAIASYTGDYALGDLEVDDETHSNPNFGVSFTLLEAPQGDIMASLFDTNAARTKPYLESAVRWQAGTLAPANGVRGTLASSTSSAQDIKALFASDSDASTNPTADTVTLTAGDKVEWVGFVTLTGFAADLSANKLMGIRLGDGTVDFDKTTTARNQILVGADSTGAVFLVNANTSAVTSTNTGVVAVSGTRMKMRITFVVGSYISVVLNDAATTTNTTNLPTIINTMNAGWGASGAGSKSILSQGAAWKYQASA